MAHEAHAEATLSTRSHRAAALGIATARTDAGADAVLVEKMSDLEEARLAIAAARTTGLPAIASFSFHRGMMGVTLEQAARAAAECGAACGLPLWMKTNNGLPSIIAGRVEGARSILAAGATFIGCGGATPDLIRALAGRVV